MSTREIRQYQTSGGRMPVAEWLDGLRDGSTRARIVARLDRLAAGLRGDWKPVGGGVSELRINHGPGYRVYYAERGSKLIILLCGGEQKLAGEGLRAST